MSLFQTKHVSGIFTKFSPGIYDDSIYYHWVDATAVGDLFPRAYHQPSSQHKSGIIIAMVTFIN